MALSLARRVYRRLTTSRLIRPAGMAGILFDAAPEIARISKACDFKTEILDDEILCVFNGLQIAVQTAQEVRIIEEIFFDHTYDVVMPGPSILLDIGMNIGVASLYFAQKSNIEAVFSFEPFRPTFDRAMRNFSFNPSLAAKITPNHFGVGANDETLTVPYCADLRGSVGVREQLADFSGLEVTQESVQIRAAADVLDEITSRFSRHHVVAKIDCEGAEYEIIESLAATGQLGRIDALMIEHHLHGTAPLLKHLAQFGFVAFDFGFDKRHGGEPFGMLYAARNIRG